MARRFLRIARMTKNATRPIVAVSFQRDRSTSTSSSAPARNVSTIAPAPARNLIHPWSAPRNPVPRAAPSTSCARVPTTISDSAVATLSEQGELKGPGLKHTYKFNDKGELLDSDGHGVRVLADGGVRGIGGKWRYKEVMVWAPAHPDEARWDHSGWRAVAIVSLVVIENMLPDALR